MALKAYRDVTGGPVSDLIESYNYLLMMRGRGVDVRVTNNSYGTSEAEDKLPQAWKESVDALGEDAAAPAAVGDLAASAATPWSVRLNWTATGDDAATRRAGFYDLRYSTSPITAANWSAAGRAAGEPAPAAAGSAESATVSDLLSGTTYYFAFKVKDNAGNESGPSNLAQGGTTAARFLLNDDVESGAANWTATGLWHPSTVRGHDSANAWYYGQDSTRTYFNSSGLLRA